MSFSIFNTRFKQGDQKMKRRTFGLLASTSLASLKFGYAVAQTAPDASLLKTTLTPMGAERAGNADGSIPAWTGGATTPPAGWQPGAFMPDLFANEAPVVVINSSNMTQHADNLSDGTMAMMQKYGYSIKVYPSHRTAAAPQEVYDNIALNATRAQLSPQGPRFGFSGAFGGIPFPIPDASDPYAAGAQIIMNHDSRWIARGLSVHLSSFVITNGTPVLTAAESVEYRFPYYAKGGSPATFNGQEYIELAKNDAPPNLMGEQVIEEDNTNDLVQKKNVWELLNGQGRVRKAPELNYDTPSAFADGMANFDEYNGFTGSLDRYDWKCLGKKELYIPYNCNAVYAHSPEDICLPHFVNPDILRWELHRVWVVEATLHPGERNVLARRRFYVDEDTWTVATVDAWDANNSLFHVNSTLNYLRPDLPGLVMLQGQIVNNLQSGQYLLNDIPINQLTRPTWTFLENVQVSDFDPQNMAAGAQY